MDPHDQPRPYLSIAALASSLALGSCGLPPRAEPRVAPLPPAATKLPPPSYTEPTWHAEGLVADACQCTIFCPCEFMSLPSHGCCDDTAIIHVEHGAFGGVGLDHTDVVVVSESPAGSRMVDNVGKLVFARIYVSKSVSDAQANALADLARRVMGTWVKDRSRLSPDESVHKVDLTVSAAPERTVAKIPGVLELVMEPLPGGDGKTPIRIQNSPWSAPGIGDVSIAHSTIYDYTSEGRDWHYGGLSASFRAYTLGGNVKEEPPAAAPK